MAGSEGGVGEGAEFPTDMGIVIAVIVLFWCSSVDVVAVLCSFCVIISHTSCGGVGFNGGSGGGAPPCPDMGSSLSFCVTMLWSRSRKVVGDSTKVRPCSLLFCVIMLCASCSRVVELK